MYFILIVLSFFPVIHGFASRPLLGSRYSMTSFFKPDSEDNIRTDSNNLEALSIPLFSTESSDPILYV